MSALAAWLQPRWPLLALLASAAMLAVAHASQRFGGLAPCVLCLEQRNVHWGVIAVSLAALVSLRFRPAPGLARLAAVVIGLVFLASAAIALYHVAVEQRWVMAQCDAASLDEITAFGAGGSLEMPRCDEIQFSFLGVSMAGWNALASLGLAGLSFWTAGAKRDA